MLLSQETVCNQDTRTKPISDCFLSKAPFSFLFPRASCGSVVDGKAKKIQRLGDGEQRTTGQLDWTVYSAYIRAVVCTFRF